MARRWTGRQGWLGQQHCVKKRAQHPWLRFFVPSFSCVAGGAHSRAPSHRVRPPSRRVRRRRRHRAPVPRRCAARALKSRPFLTRAQSDSGAHATRRGAPVVDPGQKWDAFYCGGTKWGRMSQKWGRHHTLLRKCCVHVVYCYHSSTCTPIVRMVLHLSYVWYILQAYIRTDRYKILPVYVRIHYPTTSGIRTAQPSALLPPTVSSRVLSRLC